MHDKMRLFLKSLELQKIMLPTNNDKKNLIQSMKKLANYISNNSNRQKQIFRSLSANDLHKIIQNLNDENQYLRRISALLLCQLFYNNQQLKQAFINKFKIQPGHGRICINGLNQAVQRYPTTLKKCLELLKSPIQKGEDQNLCWTINLDKKNIHLEHFQFKKYSSFTFLDPSRNIFGICVPITSTSRQQFPTQSVSVELKKQSMTTSGMYSKKYHFPSQQLQSKRPSTSKERQSSRQDKFKYIKLNNFSFNRDQKMNSSIYEKGKHNYNKQRHSMSFNYGDQHRRQTDRKLRDRNLDLMITERSSIDSRHPHSTKNENFYKRVQQILRK